MSYPGKVSFKGQITIPKELRKKLEIKPGDFVIFAEEGKKVVLKKARISPEKEFNKLVAVLDKKVKQLGIKDKDIEGAVKWARQK